MYQKRIPQSQSQRKWSFRYGLPPGDTPDVVSTSSCSPLEEAITNYFRSQSVANFNDSTSHLYMVNDAFKEPYWKDILSDRLEFSNCKDILYRPEIVNEIVSLIKENLANMPKHGVMIKGPPGIGKSHSIVNAVRKLQSTGNYLVTFMNCESWSTLDDLVSAICSSFGTSYDLLNLRYFKQRNEESSDRFHAFLDDVSTVLKQNGKQWVFVFDHIN